MSRFLNCIWGKLYLVLILACAGANFSMAKSAHYAEVRQVINDSMSLSEIIPHVFSKKHSNYSINYSTARTIFDQLNNVRQNMLTRVPDTIPKSVQCERIKRCDHYKVCAIVCKHGTVHIDPWLVQTLTMQRRLAYTQDLCNIQIPGSHNSGINLADGYGVEDHVFDELMTLVKLISPSYGVHTSDQFFSLTDQLRFGVRLIEIDVHWFDNDLRVAHCGGFHTSLLDDLIDGLNHVAKLLGLKIQWDSQTIGCKPSLSSIPASEQRRVKDALEEVSNWINAPENQQEFLMIFFDDESDLNKWNKVNKLVEYLHQYFPPEQLFTQLDFELYEKIPTAQELIDRGKRIMVLSGSDYGVITKTIMFDKLTFCNWKEPNLPFDCFPHCSFINYNTSSPNNHSLIRPQTSEIQYGPLNADGHLGTNNDLLNEETLPSLLECNVNIPSPDNLTPKRMEAFVWSWAPSEPRYPNDCTLMSRLSSRWRSHECSKKKFAPACRDQIDINVWKLGLPSIGKNASSNCPLGSIYVPPTNGYQNRIVYELIQISSVEGVWINTQNFSSLFSSNQQISVAIE